jgi:hypothetical protein
VLSKIKIFIKRACTEFRPVRRPKRSDDKFECPLERNTDLLTCLQTLDANMLVIMQLVQRQRGITMWLTDRSGMYVSDKRVASKIDS